MVQTDQLYQIIEQAKICLEEFTLPTNESLSLMENGRCFIGIDPNCKQTEAQARAILAHEIGHCMTGAFYNHYSSLNCMTKNEQTADHWAVEQLMPWEALSALLESGQTEEWEIAEHFSVPQSFVRRALFLYQQDDLYHPPIAR